MMDRRDEVLQRISESNKPLSASALAKEFNVSRQIIVGDVALLRARGIQIIATPRGYICEPQQHSGLLKTIAVAHSSSDVKDELYTIVDHGGMIVDVVVEHPVYGELVGNLHISSRYDVDAFVEKVEKNQAQPLSNLTDGLHLHTIQCSDEACYERIIQVLSKKGYLYKK